MAIPPPPQQHTDQRRAGDRRPVIELRNTPVELISQRLAKALLAPRLRAVAHIHGAPREQGGGRAANPNGDIPTGHHFAIARQNHHTEEHRHDADETRARDVGDPSLDAQVFASRDSEAQAQARLSSVARESSCGLFRFASGRPIPISNDHSDTLPVTPSRQG